MKASTLALSTLCCFLFVIFTVTVFADESPYRLLDERLVFEEVKHVCDMEGGLYNVSTDAIPRGLNMDLLTGAVIPDDMDEIVARDLVTFPPLKSRLASKFDLREKNAVSPIKHQRSCGSCWAFGGIAAFESAIMLKDGKTPDLAEQDLVNYAKYGTCSGGYLSCVKYFVSHGAVQEKDCPYRASNGSWESSLPKPYRAAEVGYVKNDVDQIKQAIMTYGAISTVIASDSQVSHYSGGIFNHDNNYSTNHIVALVGWDDSLGSGCWIMKNSWGTSWGERGFMYIEYGKCSIGNYNAFVKYDGSSFDPDSSPTPNPTPGPTPSPNPSPSPTPYPVPDIPDYGPEDPPFPWNPTPDPTPAPTPNPQPNPNPPAPTPNPVPDPVPNPAPNPAPVPPPAPNPNPLTPDQIIDLIEDLINF
ncbi:MAG: C1 family peptidase [Candidatus Wallbacteria bacterium]|nr:C1 family peptidase [Candidatus Wallbacteria bacterium]